MKMSKYDYLKFAYKNNMHLKRWWAVRVFSVPVPTKSDARYGLNPTNLSKVGYFYYDENGDAYAVVDNGSTVRIDNKSKEPLFGVKEAVTVEAGDFAIAKNRLETYYSNLYLNLVLLDYAFKDKIPFINSKFSIGLLDKTIASALKKKVVSVKEYLTYTSAVGFITCLSNIAIPCATPKSIVTPKHLIALRDKLIAENKDKLHDPVVVSKIEGQLIQGYKDYIAGDDSTGFFDEKKSYDITIKKSHLIFGAEPKLDKPGEVSLAIPSLSEGWRVEDLPTVANSLRMGSYGRGIETALGGEAAKFSARIYQNTELSEDDCKTTVGIPTTINKFNVNAFSGRFKIENGKTVEITEKPAIGSTIYLRSPQTCKTEGGNYCKICMGKAVSESGLGIGPQASRVGSVFLKESLKKFHASIIKTEVYDYESSID